MVRILSVVDVFTRECLALETDTCLGSGPVTRVLKRLIEERGRLKLATFAIRAPLSNIRKTAARSGRIHSGVIRAATAESTSQILLSCCVNSTQCAILASIRAPDH
jgi:hypothetical protein